MTSVTIADQYEEVTVKVHRDDMTLHERIDELVIPALEGKGYGNVRQEFFDESGGEA